MDDIWQILVYVVFFIIYLISKVLNNKKKQPVTRMPEEEVERDFSDPERPRRSPEADLGGGKSGMDEPPRRKRSGSFGKMLRDFTNAEQWEQNYQEKEGELQDQRRKAWEKAEDVGEQLEQKGKTYYNKTSDALRRVRDSKKTYAKQVKEIEKMTEGLRRKQPYQKSKDKTMAHNIARTLKNPETARHAIILGEILNRKHF